MTDKSRAEMPFLEHLEELRWRIIKIISAVIITSIGSYMISDYLFAWLRWPLENAVPPGSVTLTFLKVGEGFTVRVKLAILAGIFISIPIIVYQIWRFVMPALYQKEKRVVIPLVFVSSILFLTGSLICFFWVLPMTIKFLIAVAPENVKPILTINEYLNFVMWTTLSYGLVFQLPIVSLFLGKIGLINARMLNRGRRYAILVIAIVAAVVTPPDVFSMMMMGLPLYALYEISILVLYIIGKSGKGKKIAG